MDYNFRPSNRDQLYLMPDNIRDWLPADHLAWFILDVVDQMDVQPILKKYRKDGWGGMSFHPSMMASLLLYAFCNGVRSSRMMEKLSKEHVGYRVITANQFPDHSTICRFRQRHGKELGDLFIQVLKLCGEAGIVKMGTASLDGTKVEANASLAANRTHQSLEKEVKKMLEEAEATDKAEDQQFGPGYRGDELPEGLRNREDRLKRLQEAKARLEREAAEEAAEFQARLDERKAKEEATGKKTRGRRPKQPEASVPEEKKANMTDPDSRIMKTRQGYVQGYNGQIVVTEDQIIVAAELTQDANDVQQLHPMLEQAQENLQEAGIEEPFQNATADAGYWSEANIQNAPPEGPELYVATTKEWKQRKVMREQDPPRGRIPKNLTPKERMERKLRTKAGHATYAKRGKTVEPVFGQMKSVLGFTRFMRRGEVACASEWKLMCVAHNLLKLFRKTARVHEDRLKEGQEMRQVATAMA